MPLLYEVTKQFASGNEQVRARFADLKDAKEFLEAKAAWDRQTLVKVAYRLYEAGELALTIDTSTKVTQVYEENLSSSGSNGNYSSPTPLATAPRPPGSLPPKSDRKDHDDVI